MNNLFKIKTFLSTDKKYLFCNCCLSLGEVVIGDYEQTVLASILKLSFEDLLLKLKNYELMHIEEHRLETFFHSISCDINKSCLPISIESFDGDFGVFCYINNKEFLILRKWQCLRLIKVEVSKEMYSNLIANALSEIHG